MNGFEEIVRPLEENFSAIRDEFFELRKNNAKFNPWQEYDFYTGEWTTYTAYIAANGKIPAIKMPGCKFTAGLLSTMPDVIHGIFSRLAPNTIIRPHYGYPDYSDKILRLHLPIVVPEGDCKLKVEETVYTWQESKCLVFDDSLRHEAWNKTTQERIVLLLDFKRPKDFKGF